jgi:hypothetical protein
VRYLENRVYYYLQLNEHLPNPDQRIADDARAFTATTLSFILMIFNATLTVVAFASVLWTISLPLFIVAVCYAGLGSVFTLVLGRPLVWLNYNQSDHEANLRSEIRVRENAERVALTRGEGQLRGRLLQRLDALTDNCRRTPTETPTNTATPDDTDTPTETPTETPTDTPSTTPTLTLTPTDTATQTPTVTPTQTNTEGPTQSTTPTGTITPTPVDTGTPTITPTPASLFLDRVALFLGRTDHPDNGQMRLRFRIEDLGGTLLADLLSNGVSVVVTDADSSWNVTQAFTSCIERRAFNVKCSGANQRAVFIRQRNSMTIWKVRTYDTRLSDLQTGPRVPQDNPLDVPVRVTLQRPGSSAIAETSDCREIRYESLLCTP